MEKTKLIMSAFVLSLLSLTGCGEEPSSGDSPNPAPTTTSPTGNSAPAPTATLAVEAPVKVPPTAENPKYTGTFAKTTLGGLWVGDCVAVDKTSTRAVMSVFKNGVALEITNYNDQKCTKPDLFSALKVNSPVSMANVASYQFTVNQSMVNDFVMISFSKELTDNLNTSKACGKADWVSGVPVHITGTDCSKIDESQVSVTLSDDLKTVEMKSCTMDSKTGKQKCDPLTFHRK